MKIISLAIPLLLFAAATSTSLAQDHTIGGKAVPEGQMSAVQARCDELQVQQGLTGSQQPETSMDAATEAKTDPVVGETGDTAFDVASITLQQCVDGGFIQQNSQK